jgi:hypothetical protein
MTWIKKNSSFIDFSHNNCVIANGYVTIHHKIRHNIIIDKENDVCRSCDKCQNVKYTTTSDVTEAAEVCSLSPSFG